MKNIVTGIDIGGTHITACMVDIAIGEIVEQSYVRMHVDTSLNKDAIISSWIEAIQQAHANTGIEINKIGIAIPGPFDYEKGISYIKGLYKYESLYGLNIKDILAVNLGVTPGHIRMINDASAYLLGEMRAGAGRGFKNVVGITLGTGLGSAVYQNDVLQEGDLYCTEYENGKCEDFVSARWLIYEYEKLTGTRVNNVKQIADNCKRENKAKEVFEKFGKNLYDVLKHRYFRQSPEVVVVGGNIANAWEQFTPATIKAMNANDFHFTLKKAELG